MSDKLRSTNICCFFNLESHYREPIYSLMDRELGCDFFFGQDPDTTVKTLDTDKLKGFKDNFLHKKIFGYLHYYKKSTQIAFGSYDDYIMTGDPFCFSMWIILLILKLRKKRTYLWTHGWYGREGLVKRIIKRVFFSLSTKVLLYGDYARELMIKEGFKPENLISIYNSLDYDKQLVIRSRLINSNIYMEHFGNDNPVAIYIGRIQKIKKLDMVIESMRILKANGCPVNFVIVGKEDDDFSLQKLVNEYGLDENVWFYGPNYDEEVTGELLYNADVCVSPGNVGLTAMHSLAYGTPVVTHNNFANQMPEFEAIEDEKTGSFFKEGSVDDFCEKIANWLGLSGEKRDGVRKQCYRVIDEKYNPNVQIRIIKKTLELVK